MEVPTPPTSVTEYLMIKVYPFLNSKYLIKIRKEN